MAAAFAFGLVWLAALALTVTAVEDAAGDMRMTLVADEAGTVAAVSFIDG